MAEYINQYERAIAPRRVDALRLTAHTTLTLVGEVETGKPGDYLVTFPNGMQGIVTKESFEHVYRPAPAPALGTMSVRFNEREIRECVAAILHRQAAAQQQRLVGVA